MVTADKMLRQLLDKPTSLAPEFLPYGTLFVIFFLEQEHLEGGCEATNGGITLI